MRLIPTATIMPKTWFSQDCGLVLSGYESRGSATQGHNLPVKQEGSTN